MRASNAAAGCETAAGCEFKAKELKSYFTQQQISVAVKMGRCSALMQSSELSFPLKHAKRRACFHSKSAIASLLILMMPAKAAALSCPTGTYELDVSTCMRCPLGYFQSATAQSSCDACPAGQYCPMAAISPAIRPQYRYFRWTMTYTQVLSGTELGIQISEFHFYNEGAIVDTSAFSVVARGSESTFITN